MADAREAGGPRRVGRREAARWLGGAATVFGAVALAGCGAVPGAYQGPGTAAVNLATANPAHPASMFSDDSGAYTLVARGAGLNVGPSGHADDFSYYFAETRGDGNWSCYVQSLGTPSGDQAALAGLMARSSAAPSASNVAVLLTVGQGVLFQWRLQAGQPEVQYPIPIAIGVSAPIWVRLGVSGAVWWAWYSQDGRKWVNGTHTHTPFDTSRPYLIGLAASSHDSSQETVAVFRDLRGFRPNQYMAITPAAPAAKG